MIGNGIPIVLLILIGSIVYFSLTKLIENEKWVKHTYLVISNGNQIKKLLVDMETGERGFLIAGKDEFLEPYNNGKASYETVMRETKELVNDNPAQVERLVGIDRLVA